MSQSLDPDKDVIEVNKILGEKASIGPIPADQFVPWIVIAAIVFFVFYMLLGLGFNWWLAISAWLITSWRVLTGKKTYDFINKWMQPPGKDWINWNTLWISVSDYGIWKRKRTEKIQSVKVKTEQGFEYFMPFQRYSHLHQILQIEIGGHSFACLLMYEQTKDQWSAVIPFKFEGLHPQLYGNEVQEYWNAIKQGMAELLPGEHIDQMIGCYSDDSQRQQQLEDLANRCELIPNSVLLRNEQQRVRELTQAGMRQIWKQYFFCTWTASRANEQEQDLIGNALRSIDRWYKKWVRKLAGTEKLHSNNFYCEIGQQIYESGYLRWKLLLETKSELSISPLDREEIWEWLWKRFNQSAASKLPHSILIRETEKGLEKEEPDSGQKDLLSILIQGENGISSCPKHKQSRDTVYVNRKACAVLVMEKKPDRWHNQRQQLQWIWQRLSSPYVRDTEAWISITKADEGITIDNLIKISKQSTTANHNALEDGSGKDISASMRQEQSFDAQRRIHEGGKPLHCAPVFLVYRNTSTQLEEACALLCNSFGTASVVREREIAWNVWLETLPFNNLRLLQSSNKLKFSDRRCQLDNKSVMGLMSLTCPKSLDNQGVEFITSPGGKPIYVDLFEAAKCALIIGIRGTGKSVLGYRFAIDALAQGIPVLGIDLSTGGDSTFKTAIEMLGDDDAAYIDILSECLNLIEPPDLFHLDRKEQVKRLKQWQNFVAKALVAIAMGSINDDQQLRERVESIVVKLLEVFFSDPEIVERYNEAFECGWKSEEWQRIPTLHDLIKFCSKEKLGLTSVEEIDRRAINQIYNQIENKLSDPNIGDTIGKPSTVSPYPKIKFFSLSGLTNESNAYVMAIIAQISCLRMALSHKKSLFIGDELNVLLAKRGFAEVLGEFYALGRHCGLSILTLSHEIESICQSTAASKILGNNHYVLTGKITQSTVNQYVETLKYDRAIISANATEKYDANQEEYYTHWLIEKDGRFWNSIFCPGGMTLAALASNQSERDARQRVLSNYPNTMRGFLEGLHHFYKLYIPVLKGSGNFSSIGLSEPINKVRPRAKV